MREPSPSQLTLQVRPYFIWFLGLFFAGMGLAFMFLESGAIVLGMIFFAVGSLIVAFTYQVTITLDKPARILTLHNRSLIHSSFKEVYLDEISSIELESSRSSRGGTTYRLIFLLKDNSAIPLVGYFSSGYSGKEAMASRLREFIGLSHPKVVPASISSSMPQREGANPVQRGTTSSVTWAIEQEGNGLIPVTRWVSPDFCMPNGFLLLAQKPKGGIDLPGGWLGGVSRLLYEQLVKMCGFRPETLPGFATATPLEPHEPRFEPFYATLTSQQAFARQILTPWAVLPLVQWAERHPLQNPQSDGQAGQLVVMFSPEETVLACLSPLSPAVSAELEALGVDLVKSQGRI